MADAARQGGLLCSGARFTHVVDNSIIYQRLRNWISTDCPIRLHGTDVLFYMQSARESAQLLLNAGLDVRADQFQLHAIRDLDLPVSLLDLALGTLRHTRAVAPIYFCGFESGYEEQAYPGLYDPSLSGDVSPLVNAFEAPRVEPSETCTQVDRFPFEVVVDSVVADRLATLEAACAEGAAGDALCRIMDELSWAVLDAQLMSISADVLRRAARRMDILSVRQPMNEEHARINAALYRSAAAAGVK